MKIIIIDYEDSFCFNIKNSISYFIDINNIAIYKYSETDIINKIKKFDKIILSPGPGKPNKISKNIIDEYKTEKPILGICLGHQSIGEYFGCKLIRSKKIYHGVQDNIFILHNNYIFKNMPNKIKVGRYHSWVLENTNKNLIVHAKSCTDNSIMSISHNKFDIIGIQFHPESILTPLGNKIIKNWISY